MPRRTMADRPSPTDGTVTAQALEIPLCPRRSRALVPMAIATAAAMLIGCGSAPVGERPAHRPATKEREALRYPAALRLAARARLNVRAGRDTLAGEYYRAAYRTHADLHFLFEYARAMERAERYAEAHEALKRAQMHPLSQEERERVDGDVARLATLIPAGLVRIVVQARPDTTRVVLVPEGATGGGEPRVVIGPGTIFVPKGVYRIESEAVGYQSELRSFRAGQHDAELLAIALRRHTDAPLPIGREGEGGGLVAGARVDSKAVTTTEPAGQRDDDAVVAGAGEDARDHSADARVVTKVAPQGSDIADGDGKADEADESDRADDQDGDADDARDHEVADDRSQDAEVDKDVALDDVPAPAPSNRGGWLHRYGPFIVAGVGVATVGAGGYFGYEAMDTATRVKNLDQSSPNYTTNFNTFADYAKQQGLFANVMFATGGALVAGGALWWLLAPSTHSSTHVLGSMEGSASLLPPDVGFDGRSMWATWRF